MAQPVTIYTAKLNDEQAAALAAHLKENGFKPREVPYARFAGNDPPHSASHLELEFTPRPADLIDSDKIPIPVDRHAVYFRSVPGRYYGVQRAMVLGGEWELQAVSVDSTTQTRFVLWAPESQVYYRVLALP